MHYCQWPVFCYSYAAVGPASNFYEVCEENNPSLYQDYGKETIQLFWYVPNVALNGQHVARTQDTTYVVAFCSFNNCFSFTAVW